MTNLSYRICALIPTYNHNQSLRTIIEYLLTSGLDILIVDDGSQQQTRLVIDQICRDFPQLHLFRLEENMGKGGAVKAGLFYLSELGYTHAFQIDADGQHSLSKVESFLDLSKRNPQALISGEPVYDKTVPIGRKIGRWVTHVWVWIETLSFRISDSMCGFRIYPIQQTIAAITNSSIGLRMDFDTEVMVRLFWKGTPIVMNPVKVIYPEGNLSNFKLWADNWQITKMHTRLFFRMLCSLPSILRNRPNYKQLDLKGSSVAWSSLEERGTISGIYFLSTIYRLLGRRICKLIGTPIVLYFFITGGEQRKASLIFLHRVYKLGGLPKKPNYYHSFLHFLHFFEMGLDKIAAWSGNFNKDLINEKSFEALKQLMDRPKGGILLVSHIGNIEFCRAIADSDHQHRLHVLLHTKNSKHFSQVLNAFNPNFKLNLIEVTEIGSETIIYLKDRIEAREWVVIAADRFPVIGHKHVSYAPFLGQLAPFAQGPYIVASLLECPVYTALAVYEQNQFKIFVEQFSFLVSLDRKTKQVSLNNYVKMYAEYLEKFALKYPYQWFNFFDFWKKI
jgi:predicted LPLAT superfamily acyltransferase